MEGTAMKNAANAHAADSYKANLTGCGDHSCYVAPPAKGVMGTNGGCRCDINKLRVAVGCQGGSLKNLSVPLPHSTKRGNMAKTKEQLEAEIAPLQAALHRLKDAETLKESRALVGKCFKYRNCYSCPQKPSDYWWLYVKVVGVGDYWPTTLEFQTDKDGRIEIKTSDCAVIREGGGHIEIPAKEFNAAWKKLQKRIAGMKP
jgi:hypothetical protein